MLPILAPVLRRPKFIQYRTGVWKCLRSLPAEPPALGKNSGPMGARFLSSTGLGSGNLIQRAQFFPVPALDKVGLPVLVILLGNFLAFLGKFLQYWFLPVLRRGASAVVQVFTFINCANLKCTMSPQMITLHDVILGNLFSFM